VPHRISTTSVAQAATLRNSRLAVCATLAALLAAGSISRAADAARPDPLARVADLQPTLPRVAFADGKFLLRMNEVVVFTGSANVVFEQQQGWLETLLAVAANHARPRFRHMGWEGDTVFEQARELNWGGWKENLDAVGASVVFAWFGQVEALDDTRTVEEFTTAYAKLLDDLGRATPRLVVLASPPFEKPATSWIPDNTPRNARVKAHADAARRLAAERGAVFVDLFTPLATRHANAPKLTDNGLHFTPEGQRVLADIIARQLGLEPSATASATRGSVREEIVRKNRFWFDSWRTMNWAFPYGDRTEQPFSKPVAGKPSLAQELLWNTTVSAWMTGASQIGARPASSRAASSTGFRWRPLNIAVSSAWTRRSSEPASARISAATAALVPPGNLGSTIRARRCRVVGAAGGRDRFAGSGTGELWSVASIGPQNPLGDRRGCAAFAPHQ
jgi:hypothetical protein